MSMVLMTAAGLSHGASAAPLGRGARAVAPVDALLELKGVHTHIGAYHILHGVDLVVPKGQLTMLLGRNGAGKTTTLRTIMGLWQASKGAVHFAGKDITALHTPQIASLNIAYVPENMGIFADLTVKENMLLAARKARNAAQMDAQPVKRKMGRRAVHQWEGNQKIIQKTR